MADELLKLDKTTISSVDPVLKQKALWKSKYRLTQCQTPSVIQYHYLLSKTVKFHFKKAATFRANIFRAKYL